MRASEFVPVLEHQMVFKKKPKGGVALKWKCAFGPRAGRIVPDFKQCSAAPNLSKAAAMKKTRARTKVKQARKSKKTKRVNPYSRLSAKLNKLRKR